MHGKAKKEDIVTMVIAGAKHGGDNRKASFGKSENCELYDIASVQMVGDLRRSEEATTQEELMRHTRDTHGTHTHTHETL